VLLDAVIGGNNEFALDLLHAVGQEAGNLVFSPYSLSTALAMTYAGARGETAQQIADVLHTALSPTELFPALAALNRGLMVTDDEGGFELAVANAIWAQQGVAFRPEFSALLADHGARPQLVNFRSEAGRQAAGDGINRWVRDATNRRILDLVDPRRFTDLTRLVLTNAITLDGQWETPFDDTAPAAFTTADGTSALVQLMQRRAITSYGSGESWQAAELGYAGGRAHMLILLPIEGTFEAFERELDAARLAEIEAALTPTDLALYLPRFVLASDLTLAEKLIELGMDLPFSTAKADFSGMAEASAPLRISHVLHRAHVAVDELGTAAAAATAVEHEVWTEDTRPEIMRADRPFLFLIRGTEHGVILFLGRLLDPTQ
jgi:serpin B